MKRNNKITNTNENLSNIFTSPTPRLPHPSSRCFNISFSLSNLDKKKNPATHEQEEQRASIHKL